LLIWWKNSNISYPNRISLEGILRLGRSEQAAERVLDELNIVDPKDLRLLEEIAYERGALVREKFIEGAEARITIVGSRGIITLSPEISNHRRRFSIAHELGHLEMHSNVSSQSLCTKSDMDDWGTEQVNSNREQEANAFAAALLLPRRFFGPLCNHTDPSLKFVQALSLRFDTSLTATALRYTQFCDEAIAVVFSQNGSVKWFRRSKEFEELGAFIQVRSRLDPDSVAYLVYRGGVTIERKRIDVTAWLAPGNYRENAKIVEQSWSMSAYNAVLTLLWIEDDISDDNYFWSIK